MRYTPDEAMKLPEGERIGIICNLFKAADPETVRAFGRTMRKLYGNDEQFKRFCQLLAGELLMRYGRVTVRSQRYTEHQYWSDTVNWWSGFHWTTTA